MCDALCAPVQRSKPRRILTVSKWSAQTRGPRSLSFAIGTDMRSGAIPPGPSLRNVIVVLSAHIVNDMLPRVGLICLRPKNPDPELNAGDVASASAEGRERAVVTLLEYRLHERSKLRSIELRTAVADIDRVREWIGC